MDKIIIYGLGKGFVSQLIYLKANYEIVGCSDKNVTMANKAEGLRFILPEDMHKEEFDYVYITSEKYFKDIKDELVNTYKIEKSKVISRNELFGGSFENAELRHKWVIDKLSQISEGKIILDAGAGEQRYAPYCRHLKYIAQDFGKYDPLAQPVKLNTGKDEWDTSNCHIISDITEVPLEDNSLDVILCTEVFEHLKNPVLAVEEFSRLLKKDGKLILTAPFCSLTHMAPYYFANGFSKYWYKEHLEENGFIIKEIVPYGNFFRYLCQELFRVSDIAKTYCDKGLTVEEAKDISKTINILSSLGETDCGSEEILCFGYMVVAKKV